ncbi:MAG: hypothetical protein R3Y26_08830 [Rikenellaceae bacterium]
MKNSLAYLTLLVAFTFVSCDLISEWEDPDNPYEEYQGRMIDRIRIDESGYGSDYIYYDYDRKGRIESIENTYYNTFEEYSYTVDQYGDDMITVWNNIGDDRDIVLNWYGYAKQEWSYYNGEVVKLTDYSYLSKMLSNVYVEEYSAFGMLLSEASYDFDYDYANNLKSISCFYEEEGYYIDSKLTYSGFCDYENNYNVDILSILELYIDDDFASRIGRTGNRSSYLPTQAILRANRNGRYDDDVVYRIRYTSSKGLITSIEISSSLGMDKTLYITYCNF